MTGPPRLVDWFVIALAGAIVLWLPGVSPRGRMIVGGFLGGGGVLTAQYLHAIIWAPARSIPRWDFYLRSTLFYWFVETVTGMYFIRFGGGIDWRYFLLGAVLPGSLVGLAARRYGLPPVRSAWLVAGCAIPLRVAFAFVVARGTGGVPVYADLGLFLVISLLLMILAGAGAVLARACPWCKPSVSQT